MSKYIRKRNILFLVVEKDGKDTGQRISEKFPSISQAKRHSRHLQGAGHKVEVDHSEDPKPKPLNFERYGSKQRDAARRFIDRKEREERERIVSERKRTENTLTLAAHVLRRVKGIEL